MRSFQLTTTILPIFPIAPVSRDSKWKKGVPVRPKSQLLNRLEDRQRWGLLIRKTSEYRFLHFHLVRKNCETCTKILTSMLMAALQTLWINTTTTIQTNNTLSHHQITRVRRISKNWSTTFHTSCCSNNRFFEGKDALKAPRLVRIVTSRGL